jgi:hypothetical protein
MERLRVVRRTRGDEGAPDPVRVGFADPEPNGVASLIGTLIEQNLARDPGRVRLLRPGVFVISATDADVAVTIRLTPDTVTVANGEDPRAPVVVRAPGRDLFELAATPVRFGLPDPASKRGRAVIGAIARRRIRVRGVVLRLLAVRRLTMLLSAR